LALNLPNSDRQKIKSADPRIAGRSETPAKSGPKEPITKPPNQAPIIPKMIAVSNPPGMLPGAK